MKIVFNDASELMVQDVGVIDERLNVVTASALAHELKEQFANEFACRVITVKEDGEEDRVYEKYTELYKIEDYLNGTFCVVLNKSGDSDADRIEAVNGRVDDIEAVIDIITGGAAYEL